MNPQMLDSTFFFTEQECQRIFKSLAVPNRSFNGTLPPKGAEYEAGMNDGNGPVDGDMCSSFNFNSPLYHTVDHDLHRSDHGEVPFAFETLSDTIPLSEHNSDWFSLASFPPTSMTSDDMLTFDPNSWEPLASHHTAPNTEPIPQMPFGMVMNEASKTLSPVTFDLPATDSKAIAQIPFDVATTDSREPRSADRPKFVRPSVTANMRRHTDSVLPMTAQIDSSETTPGAQSSQGLRQQRNHYVIERRYRTNLNEKLRELDEVVPDVIPDASTAPAAESFNNSPKSNVSGQPSPSLTQGSTQSSSSSIRPSPSLANAAAANSKRSAKKSHVLDRTLWYIQYLESRIQHSDAKLSTMKNSIKLSLDMLMRGGQPGGYPAITDDAAQQPSERGSEVSNEQQEGTQRSEWTTDAMKQ